MSNTPTLLPCPFCGSKAAASISKSESLWSHDVVDWTRVHCTNDECNAQTEPTCEGYEPSAIEVWNRRTPHPDVASGYADGWQDGMSEATRLLTEAGDSKLGTPQPVVREPLGNKELQAISLEYSDSEDECTGFRDGWRFAEKHYGITQKGGSNVE